MIFALSLAGTPVKRIISKGILFSSFLLLIACQQIQVKETWYTNGGLRTESQYIIGPKSEIVLHGAQIDWFPNGNKSTMDHYVYGLQQGYAFRWHPNGKLKSVIHFTDGYRDDQAKFWNPNGEIIDSPQSQLVFLKSN